MEVVVISETEQSYSMIGTGEKEVDDEKEGVEDEKEKSPFEPIVIEERVRDVNEIEGGLAGIWSEEEGEEDEKEEKEEGAVER